MFDLNHKLNVLNNIFDLPLIGIGVTSPDMKWIKVNKRLCDILGYSEEELLKTTWTALTPKDELQNELALYHLAMSGKFQSKSFEKHYIRKDGSLATVLISTSLVHKSNGEIDYNVSLIQDISESRNADNKITMLAHTLKSISECVSITDMDDRIIYVNDAFIETYGYTEDELVGKHIKIVRPKDNIQAHLKQIRSATVAGVWKGELLQQRKNGTVFPAFLSTSAVKDDNGQTIALVGVATDITERKKYETLLKENENRLKGIFESVPFGTHIYEYSEGKGLIFSGSNPAADKILGIKHQSLIGKDILEAFPVLAQTDIPSIYLAIALEGRRFDSESVPYHTDEISGIFEVHAFQTGQGRMAAFFNDISTREKTRVALEQSEQKYRIITEQTGHLVYDYDIPSGKINWAGSIEEITGFGKSEFEAVDIKKWEEMIHPDDRKHVLKVLNFCMQKCSRYNVEYRFRKKDESYFFVEDQGVFIPDASNISYKMLGTMADISVRKQHETELSIAKDIAEEASRLKSSMLMNINHELRTPMNSILGFSHLLMDKLPDKETKEMALNINESAKRLMNTMNSIIDMSELESGDIDVTFKQINVADFIDSLCARYLPLCSRKNLFLTTEITEDLSILGNESYLNKAIDKIMDNALKFTNLGGITITASETIEPSGRFINISIQDSGIGIDSKFQKEIFEPFKQVSEGFSRQYEGAGLGLAISKRLIEKIDGSLSVQSQIGEGSVFLVKLPAAKIKNKPAANLQTDFSNPSEPERLFNKPDLNKDLPNILLVEDNLLNKELIKIYLKLDYLIDHAIDGQSAIQMAKEKKYDAILMDINLSSEMNGVETAQMIKKIKGYESTPIAAVTGYTSEEDIRRIYPNACNYYLAKPFDQPKLTGLLEDMLKLKNN